MKVRVVPQPFVMSYTPTMMMAQRALLDREDIMTIELKVPAPECGFGSALSYQGTERPNLLQPSASSCRTLPRLQNADHGYVIIFQQEPMHDWLTGLCGGNCYKLITKDFRVRKV